MNRFFNIRPFAPPPAWIALFLLSVGLLAGCTLRYDAPDLGDLYSQAAQYEGPERRAIIVIPGILGSTLVDQETGTTAWGAFSGGYAKPGKPEGARMVALPMRKGAALEDLRDGVVATRVLDRLQVRLLGLPVQLQAYFQMIEVLGAGGYRDETLGLSGAVDWGNEHFTCFQFPYDFRRDNVENARRLQEFILEKRTYIQQEMQRRYGVEDSKVRFDIVAHSMGGLLTRYFLRYGGADLPEDGSLPALTWKGAEYVDRVILVAPPNGGALETLVNLVEGRSFGPVLPSYAPAILGTFPSTYQMVPRGRHGAFVWDSEGQERIEDPLDVQLWQKMGWGLADEDQDEVVQWLLPGESSPGERRRVVIDHLEKSLTRARRFTAALDRPATPPSGLHLYLVAGDAVPTSRVVAVHPTSGKLRIVDQGPGDGSVLRTSALMDERVGREWSPTLQSPVVWNSTLMLFTNHLGLTRDPIFVDNVLYWLLEDPRLHP